MSHPCDQCENKKEAMPVYFYEHYEELRFLFPLIDELSWLCPSCFKKIFEKHIKKKK